MLLPLSLFLQTKALKSFWQVDQTQENLAHLMLFVKILSLGFSQIALSALDFPAFDLPAKMISTPSSGGRDLKAVTPLINFVSLKIFFILNSRSNAYNIHSLIARNENY